jgi:hypothetical protein
VRVRGWVGVGVLIAAAVGVLAEDAVEGESSYDSYWNEVQPRCTRLRVARTSGPTGALCRSAST